MPRRAIPIMRRRRTVRRGGPVCPAFWPDTRPAEERRLLRPRPFPRAVRHALRGMLLGARRREALPMQAKSRKRRFRLVLA